MEIVIDPAQLWHQFISFANNYKLLTSLVLLIVLLFLKKGVLRLIRRISSHRGEDRRNQINILEQLGNAFIIIVLMMVWSSEIQTWQSPLLPLWWQLCWQPASLFSVLWGSFTTWALGRSG